MPRCKFLKSSSLAAAAAAVASPELAPRYFTTAPCWRR
jgi:hypothetical protein